MTNIDTELAAKREEFVNLMADKGMPIPEGVDPLFVARLINAIDKVNTPGYKPKTPTPGQLAVLELAAQMEKELDNAQTATPTSIPRRHQRPIQENAAAGHA